MKIIQIMPEFGLAGAEIMCANLTLELAHCGNEVVVVSLFDYHSAITKRLEENGIKIIYLGKKRGLDLSMITKLISVFKSERPDVIHTHRYVMEYVVPAAIICRIKNRVHTVHNIAQKEVKPGAQKLHYVFYHACGVNPVALSPEIQDTISSIYKLELNCIPVVYNGIDLSKCIPKESWSNEGVFTYLHIGRFSKQKNHEMLIKAFKIVKRNFSRAKLQLIGVGELQDTIKQLVIENELEHDVEFLGLQDDVYPFLHNADAFVLPSQYEGMPMTLIEAMGTGLPIVATEVGGIPTMIDSECGILTAVDVKAIADGMLSLKDCKINEKLGRNALQRSIAFSAEKMCEDYISIYRKGMLE